MRSLFHTLLFTTSFLFSQPSLEAGMDETMQLIIDLQ